jgi:hypothetical protein
MFPCSIPPLGRKTIADPVNGFDILWVRVIPLNLGAQVADMDIDGAFVSLKAGPLQPIE